MPKLVEHNKCTGCCACVNVCTHNAIYMVEDKEGFVYPQIDNVKCIECGLCEKTCPVINCTESVNTSNPKVYAVWHEIDRTLSSSGGAFSAFARFIISKGGIVYGATFDKNMMLRHTGISSTEDLKKLRGSKYIQSNIKDTFKEVKKYLQEGKDVLYCGTPCQIAGLKSFLKKPYEKLLTLDLVCHGTPSQKIFDSYIDKLQKETNIGNIQEFIFRRLKGWGYSPTVKLESGKEKGLYGTENLYMEAFNASALLRESCYNCPFAKIPRQGDCTLADFWGIGRHGVPFKHDVMQGVSLVLVNNDRGANALNQIQNSFLVERSLEEALIENHNIIHSSICHPQREEIIKAFLDENATLDSINTQYHIVDSSIKGKIKMYASKYGLFNIAKRIYNKYKSL